MWVGLLDTMHVVTLLARPRVVGHELWTWDVWRSIARVLTPFVARPELVDTRSEQIDRDTRKGVVFPEELRWNESSFGAWAHGSPRTEARCGRWHFGSTRFFAPSWSTCVHADESPQLFVELKNKPMSGAEVEMLLVSLSVDVLGAERVPRALSELRAALFVGPGTLAAWTVRPFIHRRGQTVALVRSVDEITHNELDAVLSFEELSRGSASMDRRTRTTTDPWRALASDAPIGAAQGA